MLSFLFPIICLFASTTAFSCALQTSFLHRILLAPAVFFPAYLSLRTSSIFVFLSGLNVLWALLIAIWCLHAFAVLYVDRLLIPHTGSAWYAGWKVFADVRRRVDWKDPLRASSQKSDTRTLAWAAKRVLTVILLWVITVVGIVSLRQLLPTTNAEDFHPERQILIRRLLVHDYGPPIDTREIRIRTFIATSWIWIGWLQLHTSHVFLSILFVAILKLDFPEEWPPLFGSVLEAYSINRFWTRFWHRLTSPSCISLAQNFSRKILGIRQGSRWEKTLVAFCTFLLAAVVHTVADRYAGEQPMFLAELKFFMANFGAGAFEIFLSRIIEKSLDKRTLRVIHSKPIKNVIGFSWVLLFFFWITPKWQYGKVLHFFPATA